MWGQRFSATYTILPCRKQAYNVSITWSFIPVNVNTELACLGIPALEVECAKCQLSSSEEASCVANRPVHYRNSFVYCPVNPLRSRAMVIWLSRAQGSKAISGTL